MASCIAALGPRACIVAVALGEIGCGASSSQPSSAVKAKQIEVRQKEEHPQKLLERGRAFAELGDNGRAEQYLSGALDGGANPDVVLPLLMRVCIAERRFRVAIDYAEPHLKRRPNNYKLRFLVASLYQSIGDTASAERELEMVTRTEPTHADAHYAMAVLYRDAAPDPVKADLHFREYLRLMPRGKHAQEARASLLQDTSTAPRLPLKTVPPPTGSAAPAQPAQTPFKAVPPPPAGSPPGQPPAPAQSETSPTGTAAPKPREVRP